MNEVKLKVMEALQEEAYKGIVRIDSETMRGIGVRPGDVVEIIGSRSTVGIVDRAYPTDVGQAVIRMDGILRRNAKTGIGESVIVKKVEIKEAKSITIAPAQQGVVIQADPELFRRGLLGRAVLKGDLVVLGGARRRRRAMAETPFEEIFDFFEQGFIGNFGLGSLKFIVVDTNPKQATIITESTSITVNPKSVEVSEQERVPEVTYEDIGGLEEEIRKIREMVELPLKYPELFTRLGIEPPKGVLLHGPPGTGKTLLAKAVANESDVNFILLNGPECMSKFYGDSEKRLRDIFEEAEKTAPSIVFIDEIDSIAPKREEVTGEVERRVVATLLAELDGLKSRGRVVIIGATNRPNSIDPALRRPGRFDREINIGVPDKKGRLNVLKIHTRNMPILGSLYEDILEKNFFPQIDQKMKELIAEINRKQEEIENSNYELNKLKREKQTSEITFTIKKLNQKHDQLEADIKNDKDKFIILEKLKERLLKDKEEFMVVLNEIKSIEESNKDELKNIKKEKSEIYRELEFFGLIKNIIDKTRNDGVPRDLEKIAEITYGFVGADLSALAKEAAMNVLRKILPGLKLKENEPIPKEVLEKLIITDADFREALKIVRPSAMREVLVEKPDIGWDDIGGLEELKQELKEAVEWPLKNPGAFKRLGIRPPRGILLYGPPGTGKTLLAKAVAKESDANFILVKGPEVLDKYVGESEKGIRKIFERARQVAPAIIFFDEIDALAPRRTGGGDSGTRVTENVVNTLLSEMDGLEELTDIVVVAATNRPDILDPALLRPGRFDRILLTHIPDKKSRLGILKIHTKKMPLAKDVNLVKIAELTEGYVGSDLGSVVREAAMLSLRENINSKEVSKKYFDESLKKVKPSVTKETMQKYKEIEGEYLKSAKAVLAGRKDEMSYFG